MRTLNALAAMGGAILCVVALLVLGGCSAQQHGATSFASAIWPFVGAIVALACCAVMFGGWRDGWRPAVAFLVAAAALGMVGCAALPMPFQPQNEQYNSNAAEGAFLVLAAVDTAQTMHLKSGTDCGYEADPVAAALYGGKNPSPGRVLATNLLMITAHTMVASWLDDKVAAESAKNDAGTDNNLGPWYVGRVAFHAVSIIAEGAAVLNNHKHGCKL